MPNGPSQFYFFPTKRCEWSISWMNIWRCGNAWMYPSGNPNVVIIMVAVSWDMGPPDTYAFIPKRSWNCNLYLEIEENPNWPWILGKGTSIYRPFQVWTGPMAASTEILDISGMSRRVATQGSFRTGILELFLGCIRVPLPYENGKPVMALG